MKLERLDPFGIAITVVDKAVDRLDVAALQDLLGEHGLVLVRNLTAPTRDELLALARSFDSGHAKLLEWDFGPVMEMRREPSPSNYLFSAERVPFHWDGAFHRVPSCLVFHCLAAPTPGGGGETLFADAAALWRRATPDERQQWMQIRLVYETEKKAHYGGRIETDMVRTHPRTGANIVRFAEEVETELNPVSLGIIGLPECDVAAFVRTMTDRLYDPSYCYSHSWQDGDLLFVDNHRLLHGRRGFLVDSPRHLRRVQIL